MKARIVDRPPEPRTPEDPKRVVRLYQQLRNVLAVARQLERGSQYIRGILREQGVELHNDGTRDPKRWDLYVAWRNMVRRCDDPTHRSYPSHGARSIGYASSWAAFPSFRTWALAHGWQSGRSLILRDPDRDHSPANCYWGTRSEMLRLRTRVAPLTANPVTALGEVKSAWAWARDPRCKVMYMGLMQRLRKGWPPEAAITLPSRARRPAALVRPRPINKVKTRVDWERAASLYGRGEGVAEIAALLGCAYSTLYLGLQSRGVYEPPVVEHRRLEDGPLYGTWNRMRQLCQGKDKGRRDARPPTMDPRWEEYEVFRAWARAQRYRRGMCLVRSDPELPYRPSNCRFVRKSEITSRPAAHATPLGKPRYRLRALGTAKGIMEWSRDPRCSVTAPTIRRRIEAGWRPDDAITAPPTRPGSSGHADRLVTAFGQTKGLVEWTRDRRCRVGPSGLALRLGKGIQPEAAISTPAYAIAAARS